MLPLANDENNVYFYINGRTCRSLKNWGNPDTVLFPMLSTFLVCAVEDKGNKTIIYLREIGCMLSKKPVLHVDDNILATDDQQKKEELSYKS